MSFTGNEGKQITLEEGALLTRKYRESKMNKTGGMFIGKTHIEEILAQADCKGIRIYLGQNSEGDFELVLVGADSNENDMLNVIIDNGMKCPPYPYASNPLNGNNQ
ncbi:hypothetical protein [Fluviicola taffensis]|uniref:hypothetical protein n=1 Tax=Fluviicola taffensis TaxID=191579 RepID=UPI003137982C